MNFRIRALATPHEFYIGAKRHLLKARATRGSVGGSERTSKASCASGGNEANGKRHRGASRGALGTYYRMRFLYCLLYSGPQVERERVYGYHSEA